tara:strand:+ start:1930 stop:4398 length:2469 start_codon:yes stop_codon:yes gene_type:complete
MAKVQFQPTMRGKGYSNLDYGAITLARLEAKLKDKANKEERALQDRKNKDAEAAANIQTTNQKEEANLKQIAGIDGLASQTRQSALQVNRAQAVQNNQAEIKKIEAQGKEIQDLIGYSKTLYDAYKTSEEKDWNASYNDAFNYYMTNGQSDQTKLRMELLDDAAYDKSRGFHSVADEMAADGYTIPEVEWVRGRAKFDDYARLKADAIIAGNNFQPWLQKQLAERGITKTEDIQAFIQAATPEYLRANNLIVKDENGNDQHLSTDFLSPMIERMHKTRNTIINRAENRDAINQAEVRVNGYKTVLQAALSPTKEFKATDAGEALENYFYQVGTVPKPDGTFRTRAEQKAIVKETLEDINLFPSDEHVIQAIAAAQGKQNWYSDILPGILATRAQNRTTKEKNQAEATKRLQETTMKTFDTYLKNRGKPGGWNGSRQIVKDGIEKMAKSELNPNGIDRAVLQDRYGKYLETSVEGKLDGDWYTSHYTKLFKEDYNLTSEDLDDPTIPDGFVTDEIRQEVARRDAILDKADYKNLHKDRIEGALTNSLVKGDLEKRTPKLDPSYYIKLEEAKSEWRKCTVNSEDAEACTISLTEKIEKDSKGTTGTYGVTNYSDDGSERQGSYFTKAAPATLLNAKKSKNDYTPLNSAEKAEIAGSLAKDPTLINKRLFLSVDQIKTASARIKAGQPFRYPQLLLDLEKILPGTAMELFRAQIKVAESDKLLEKHDLDVEDFRRVWHTQTGDPQGKHIIKTLDTLVDVQKTLQWTMNPQSTRDPRFMSPGVNKTLQENVNAAQGIVVPQTVEEAKVDDRKDYDLILKQWVSYGN